MSSNQHQATLSAGTASEDDERRREERQRLIKSAKIIFENSVIDCVVADVSPNGARVRTSAIVPMPSEVVLRFRGGAAFRARRLWTMGTQMGLLYDGSAPLMENSALIAVSAFEALPVHGLDESLRILRIAEFFDDHELCKVAEDASAAYSRFKAALKAWVTA